MPCKEISEDISQKWAIGITVKTLPNTAGQIIVCNNSKQYNDDETNTEEEHKGGKTKKIKMIFFFCLKAIHLQASLLQVFNSPP